MIRRLSIVSGLLLVMAIMVTSHFARVSGLISTGHAQAVPAVATPDANPVLPEVLKPVPAQPKVGLVSDKHLDKTPPRQTKGLDLVKKGWSYNCMECHRIVKVDWGRVRVGVEHEDIQLQHGNNRFCLNCHNRKNMNAFVDYDGTEIPQEDVVLLCAKCHGTTHRDWNAGVHGRRNGYWDLSRGEQTQLRCIQCHDPHHPKFKAMKAHPSLRYPARAAGTEEKDQSREH